MNNRTVFTPAEIALPDLAINDKNRWTKWAVIACDQFTSDPGYWAMPRWIILPDQRGWQGGLSGAARWSASRVARW